MNKISKVLFIIGGFTSLKLGIIGIIMPLVPTTPFLLLSSYCFVKGSRRFDNWFSSTNIYKKYLANYVQSRSLTLKQKCGILILTAVLISFPFVMVDVVAMRVFIVFLMTCKLVYFTFGIKTLK